jgi:hypothetical protein
VSGNEFETLRRIEMRNHILLTAITVVFYSRICEAQQCPVGCEMKIDALQNQVAAMQKAIYQVPYLQKFMLTPTPRDSSRSLFSEQEFPNYKGVLLVHLSVDHTMAGVLVPSVATTSNSTGQPPIEAMFVAGCRSTGDVLAPGRANIRVFLGRLRQEASGKDVYGIRVTIDGCSPATGKIPVEVTVLSKQ